MPNKMLIDASHPEETRVVVTRGNRIEEFDFESQDKKQIRGNIYLARVTRVEPSLQAAFVEYGGNRHGFLAFSEIHPDYYQIPVADRQALLRADAEAAEAEDEEDEEERSGRGRRRRRSGKGRGRDEDRKPAAQASEDGDQAGESENPDGEPFETAPFLSDTFEPVTPSETESEADEAVGADDTDEETSDDDASTEEDTSESDDDNDDPSSEGSSGSTMPMAIDADVVSEPAPGEDEDSDSEAKSRRDDDNRGDDENGADENGVDEADEVESVGAGDAYEEAQPRRRPVRRQYKIQEVIKRRQILLVQVVKEERGNKGAALTTYLSLAGRYSVLMPNTARGGGISRKITSAVDRKRLKDVVKDLAVPQGMGVILRTAGESRTKAEIKRDYEYLMRMWENVRTLTLQSTAPALVYEEGSLIKRSVRDLYNKDIDEILVAGEDGYREAKDFMRMLMPSHAKVVQPYRETVPMFARAGIEAQLDRMLQPQVNLKSGGYIIINQTEALVAIDVNSGRSTKEHSIEDTALQTNLEAAEEVARQLRLRDLAGLIVIDFIDMEENRNNRSVEKRLKDHLKNDRARIQVGRISHFGLLEMSRQRIRTSVLESTTQTCPHCGGTGHIRSESSVALHVIRAVEEYLLKDTRHHITVRTPVSNALYVLNNKRSTLVDLERRFGLTISMEADESLGSQHYAISKGAAVEHPVTVVAPPMPVIEDDDIDEIVEEDEDDEVVETAAPAQPDRPRETQNGHGERDGNGKRKRRRRRRGGRDRDREHTVSHTAAENGNGDETSLSADAETTESDVADAGDAVGQVVLADDQDDGKKRRRGKRGGRRNRRTDEGSDETVAAGDDSEAADVEAIAETVMPSLGDEVIAAESGSGVALTEPGLQAEPLAEAKPAPRKRAPRRTKATIAAEAAAAAEAEGAAPAIPMIEQPVDASLMVETEEDAALAPEPEQAASEASAADPRPSRRRPSETPAEAVVTSSVPEAEKPNEATAPRKAGWWQRKSFF